MYGEGKNLRYIIGLGLVIVLLFIIIFVIINSGGDGKGKGKVSETKQQLVSYASNPDVTITETVIGPIVSEQDHSEFTINVTNQIAAMNVVKGYNGNVVKSQSYPTSSASFGEFLSALDKANFTKGNTDSELKDDKGYCASGQRYIFEIKDGSKSVERFWATSCGGTKTYKGNLNATLSLFRSQIPNYNDLVQDTDAAPNLLGL